MSAKTEQAKLIENYINLKASTDDQHLVCLMFKDLRKKMGGLPVSAPVKRVFSNIDPKDVVNKLYQPPGANAQKEVWNTFNNAQLSALVPHIRMFMRNRSGGKYNSEEIPLQNIHNKLDVLKSPDKQNALFGLKNMNFQLSGQYPESARSDIDATITFYGNNLSVFEKNPLYTDLIVIEGHNKAEYDERNIIVQIGWARPTGQTLNNLNFTKPQLAALDSQVQAFKLSYTKHSFNFNIDGSFTLSVDYVAQADKTVATADFLSTSALIKEVYGGNTKIKKVSAQEKNLIHKYIETNHAGASDISKKNIFSTLSHAGTETHNLFRTRYLEATKKEIKNILSKMSFRTFKISTYKRNSMLLKQAAKRMIRDSKKGGSSKETALIAAASAPGDNGSQPLNIMEFHPENNMSNIAPATIASRVNSSAKETPTIANQSIADDQLPKLKFLKVTTFAACISGLIQANPDLVSSFKQKKINICFGPIKFIPGDMTGPRVMSLGDIPVTYFLINKVLNEIYVSKVKNKLTLGNFLNKMLFYIKKYYMEGDFVFDSGRLMSAGTMRTIQVVCTPTSLTKPGAVRQFAKNVTGVNVEENFIVLAGPAADKPEVPSEYDSYIAGSTNSIIKKLNFTQSNSQVMQAHRDDNITATYRSAKGQVLPQLYNVNMEIVGNMNFIPGYTFNLVPTVVGVNPAARGNIIETLGITGVYWATRIEHTIGQNGFTTKLDAYNVASPTGPHSRRKKKKKKGKKGKKGK